MKCGHCEDPKMFFTIMPTISKTVGWCSHVMVEVDGKIGLYHYQCGNVDVMSVYEDLLALTKNPTE